MSNKLKWVCGSQAGTTVGPESAETDRLYAKKLEQRIADLEQKVVRLETILAQQTGLY